ncbi:hypothetical protein [Amorphus sp. MBR-141]
MTLISLELAFGAICLAIGDLIGRRGSRSGLRLSNRFKPKPALEMPTLRSDTPTLSTIRRRRIRRLALF